MKKINLLAFLILAIGIASCGDASTKADVSDTVIKKNLPGSDSGSNQQAQPDPPVAAPPNDSNIVNSKNESGILANIDKWLVSKTTYAEPGPAGGIVNGSVTVENTLPNTSFQKAMIEVNILLADGKVYRTDYYTVINLDPAVIKTVKIPPSTRGSSIVSHIIKVKSAELTKGEWILVGSHYTPQ